MIVYLTFSTRERYKRALAAIHKNPRYTLRLHGRDHSPNILYPWSTLFYVEFKVED
jgi:hypothetical protein